MARFPSIKAKKLFKILESLGYSVKRRRGSHRVMTAPDRNQLVFAFHDGDTVPSGLVRKILTTDAGLTEDEALGLL